MDGYSRLIRFLKVFLPLAALGLLSSLFLLSESVDPDSTIPFAESEVIDRIRGQQITEPYFTGTTSKGEEIIVSADRALPGGPGQPAEATNMRGVMKLAGGRRIEMVANSGSLHFEEDLATFTGDVVILTADGMQFSTDVLNTAMHTVEGNAPGDVHGVGPLGTLSAGAMAFGTEIPDGPVHMHFTDGVKLIYVPQNTER